jgi:hypothetical protein
MRVSVLANQQPRAVPFIGEVRLAWNFISDNSYTWSPTPPVANPANYNSNIDISGEIVVPGSRAALWTPESGFTPNDLTAGLGVGQGRTVFSPFNQRVGFYNVGGPFSAGDAQPITLIDQLDYDEDEAEFVFTAEQVQNLQSTFNGIIFQEKFQFTFSLAFDVAGRLVITFPDENTEPEDEEFIFGYEPWNTGTQEVETPNGLFDEFSLQFERPFRDPDFEQVGVETLDLTVTILPWSAL